MQFRPEAVQLRPGGALQPPETGASLGNTWHKVLQKPFHHKCRPPNLKIQFII